MSHTDKTLPDGSVEALTKALRAPGGELLANTLLEHPGLIHAQVPLSVVLAGHHHERLLPFDPTIKAPLVCVWAQVAMRGILLAQEQERLEILMMAGADINAMDSQDRRAVEHVVAGKAPALFIRNQDGTMTEFEGVKRLDVISLLLDAGASLDGIDIGEADESWQELLNHHPVGRAAVRRVGLIEVLETNGAPEKGRQKL